MRSSTRQPKRDCPRRKPLAVKEALAGAALAAAAALALALLGPLALLLMEAMAGLVGLAGLAVAAAAAATLRRLARKWQTRSRRCRDWVLRVRAAEMRRGNTQSKCDCCGCRLGETHMPLVRSCSTFIRAHRAVPTATPSPRSRAPHLTSHQPVRAVCST